MDLIDKNKDNLIYINKLINIFFDYKIEVKELDQKEIYDILETYMLIEKYIEQVHEKINNVLSDEEIEESESAFDDYDKENGYEDEENLKDISKYEISLKILYGIFDFARLKLKFSLKECLETNIFELLDYIDYSLKNKEYVQEDYADIEA
ncbi:hypothetical protein GOD95_05150 [Paeniclostridium sordellii]|uniref:hypothetical protein n=1 Tax=Paraclostridium sordellii TaxID=1505 RepID=UPI0012ED979F|nr:hypothetical protein [Paeniclostridium sordellii]MVO70830.1 hypothetical protein [Paeniclostridium sordellii]